MDTKSNLAIELGQTIYSNTIASLTEQRDALTEQRDTLAEENEKLKAVLRICKQSFDFSRTIQGDYNTRYLSSAMQAVDDALNIQPEN